MDVESEALRFRVAASKLRVSRSDVEESCRRVVASLQAERRMLGHLEVAMDRQHRRTIRALRYGCYLDVLGAHLSVATNGQICASATAGDDPELLSTCSQVGADDTLGLRVVTAHRLINEPLRQAFDARISLTSHASRRAACVFAMLLPPFAVERVVAGGLSLSVDKDTAAIDRLLLQLPSDLACVDRDTLREMISASRPLPPPFTLCHGARAWRQLRAMQAGADASLAAEEETERLDDELDAQTSRAEGDGSSDAPAAAVDVGEDDAASGGLNLMLVCSGVAPRDWGPDVMWPPTSAVLTDDADALLPLYLLQVRRPSCGRQALVWPLIGLGGCDGGG